jgi:hypothetical protein
MSSEKDKENERKRLLEVDKFQKERLEKAQREEKAKAEAEKLREQIEKAREGGGSDSGNRP